MSGGVFFLDEDRDKAPTPSPTISPRPSPTPSPRNSPPLMARHHRSPPPLPSAVAIPTSSSGLSSLQQTSVGLLSPQPQHYAGGGLQHRKAGVPFAATPSFPSPLAQAITVPVVSESSSNSSQSDEGSEDDPEVLPPASPTISSSSGTPLKNQEQFSRPRTASPHSLSASPSSSLHSSSRPPSPSRQQILTPGALLLKGKRSSHGSSPYGSLPNPSGLRESPPRSDPNVSERRESPTHPGARRVENLARGTGDSPTHHSRKRSGSFGSSPGVAGGLSTTPGTSPLVLDNSELETFSDDLPRRRSSASSYERSQSKDPSENSLGLGLGASMGATFTTPRDKGKAKEVMGPPSPSPIRARERTAPVGMLSSPPRQRRPSEFLNPFPADARKIPVIGGPRNSFGAVAVPSLTTSASMISPLNPLPSPWNSSSDRSNTLSPPNSLSSDAIGTPTSGAIRLTRVPTSVKLAAELMKNPNTASLPMAPTSPPSSQASSASVPTPNPSPASSVPAISHVPLLGDRAVKAFGSSPIGEGLISSSDRGQSLLTVPRLLRGPRDPSSNDKDDVSPLSTPIGRDEPAQLSAVDIPAPPSAFKKPALPVQRPRLPSAVDSNESLGDRSKVHRYRTSMHEAGLSALGTNLTDSSREWAIPVLGKARQASAGTSRGYGLGLNMPPAAGFIAAPILSGTMTPIGDSRLPKIRSTLGKELEMDLAGVPALADAASHASMIMQSRQAKLQRWRPASSGNQPGEVLLPPAFNRSTTVGAPAMLARHRIERQAQWDLEIEPPAASSSLGHDLPLIPTETSSAGIPPISPLPKVGDRTSGPSPLSSNSGMSRFSSAIGPMGMERNASASGSIAGIEWVDWYDCYKRYKEEKIRAESISKARLGNDSPSQLDRASMASPIPEESESLKPSPKESTLNSQLYDPSSVIALTPTTSKDELGFAGGARKRSMSVRSQLSSNAVDLARSPSQKKATLFERPRQSSAGSMRSDTSGPAGKKKKNLVTKMEGWWSAVKSNFLPENHDTHLRPLNPATTLTQRIPSAPSDRRESELSPISARQVAVLPPNPLQKDSTHSLRLATSNAELRLRPANHDSPRLQEAASIVGSISADISRLSPYPSEGLMRHPMQPIYGRKPSIVPEEGSVLPNRSTTTLEARRRQPSLRLELQPNVFTRSNSQVSGSSGSLGRASSTSGRPGIAGNRTGDAHSRGSSYLHDPVYGPGLTPGVASWDLTPSPIIALTSPGTAREDRPIAPGADITISSVRRHIKHRLNAAKEACDNTLKKTIHAMTKYAEEQRQVDIVDDQSQDYFDVVSDSPLVDTEDSDADEAVRSQNAVSRPPSRRPSMSRPSVSSSPTKRFMALPTSPSRFRRRPSAVPRNYAHRESRISRHASISLDRTQSGNSSRSTSRSRSPMPPLRGLMPNALESEGPEADLQFLAALQELIVLSTDVLDLSVNSLISQPSICSEVIQKVQKVGQNWDEHDDWSGREWYVDILMAVANLSRVLEWWAAEKGFWNFDDEDENESLLFVLKPGTKEESRFDHQFKAALTADSTAARLLVTDQVPSAIIVGLPPLEPIPGEVLTGKTVAPSFGTPKAQGVEDLRFLAEQAKSVNIVMELSLQETDILYINDAIMEVIGREPEEVLNKPISELLAPADSSVFTEATQKLLEDDNNTVQLRFRFEVHELDSVDTPDRTPGPVYIELEGVGMLMREHNEPSHTMWVLKPVTATQVDSIEETSFPRDGHISEEGILCRICEREIVTWFFEKHNETCDAVHRLEAEISACNECLHDLCQTVTKLEADIELLEAAQAGLQQGVIFFVLPDSLTATPDTAVPTGPQGVELRRVATEHLRNVVETLAVAEQIEMPSVQEDEADLAFNVQRYLSRDSEDKLAHIMRWQRPPSGDRALTLLFQHVDDQLRRKQKAIARLQSTIRYSEKTRHEWEDKVNRLLDERDDSPSESGSDGPPVGPAVSPIDVRGEQSEVPPFGHRKIAPQARLPITTGHPQRPSTSHGESSTMLSVIPTSSTASTIALDSEMPSAPLSAPLLSAAIMETVSAPLPSQPEPPRPSSKAESKSSSPLLVPLDRIKPGHTRRVSTSRHIRDAPLSPRIPPTALPSRAGPTSIKDFEIIKPISRGAFGSVYLAKKVTTGDYFAIKALKKSDMIAKNQITNVKAERTILMNQASSPYVAKLFFSFQSKEYLYLVMEYLNGGDCASLVKTLGGLPEEWARNYIAEVVLGLEYLHARNVVHRDIKPDNLLIDSRGHLKLTDFGLSRIGLLNRQVGGPRPAYLRGTALRASSRSIRPSFRRTSSNTSSADSPVISPDLLPAIPLSNLSQSYFNMTDTGEADESSGSESSPGIIPKHMRHMSIATKLSSDAGTPSLVGREMPRFVGTPDYLAPESILGIGSDDAAVDWWALGVVMYEFLYGFPPFHADSPETVFDNVVSRRLNFHEDEMEISPEARDLMDRLMCTDVGQRLGARGAEEVKRHAFFAGVDWDTIATSDASFVPEITDPESTDYFDARGAINALHDEETLPQVLKQSTIRAFDESPAAKAELNAVVDDIASQDDFGAFNFKNLPVLKQANDDVIRKLRVDSMGPIGIGQILESAPQMQARARSLSTRIHGPPRRKASAILSREGPPSPATSASSAASTPSRASIPPSTPMSMSSLPQHFRRPSGNALDRVKSSDDTDVLRRASAPSRVRAGSGSSFSDRSASTELWRQRRQASLNIDAIAAGASLDPSSDHPESRSSAAGNVDRTLDVLIAEDNPISQKILETLLTRMGCRCICVDDGPQALAATMGSIRFDVIVCDIHMPVVNGEQVARMIRSTNNHNQNTPIIACTSYEQHHPINEEGTLFSAVLSKPVNKADIMKCLAKLGFVLSSMSGSVNSGPSDIGSPPAL